MLDRLTDKLEEITRLSSTEKIIVSNTNFSLLLGNDLLERYSGAYHYNGVIIQRDRELNDKVITVIIRKAIEL